MTPEGVLLQNTCSFLKLNSNATVKVMKEQVSSKLGINLTGPSLEEEASKISVNSTIKCKFANVN